MKTIPKVGGAVVLLAALAGCNSKGACVQTFDDGKTFTCTHMKKSTCEQGKGDKFMGGECKDHGFSKKDPKHEDSWDK